MIANEDLDSSMAILNPNIPGSTKLTLSWIWQTGRYHTVTANVVPAEDETSGNGTTTASLTDQASLTECKLF